MIKLLIFLAFIYILASVLKIFISDYDKCYSEMENAGIAAFNCCCGLTGGTRHTDYLQRIQNVSFDIRSAICGVVFRICDNLQD